MAKPDKGKGNGSLPTPKVQTIAIKILKPHPLNPRVHPDSLIAKLARSIEEFGWTNPVIVNSDMTVLAGHARLSAAKKLGLKEVPVIVLDLPREKAGAYVIADNRIADESEWDRNVLKELLLDIDVGTIDMTITGFVEKELEALLAPLSPPVEFPSADESLKTEHVCPKCGYEWSGKGGAKA